MSLLLAGSVVAAVTGDESRIPDLPPCPDTTKPEAAPSEEGANANQPSVGRIDSEDPSNAEAQAKESTSGAESASGSNCMELSSVPKRPRPAIEWGERFLDSGNLRKGVRIPTGAIWHPSLIAFGTIRSAVQTFQNRGASQISEAAISTELFANLYLSRTERVLFGVRPLDQIGPGGGRQFTTFTISDPGDEDRLQDELNFDVSTLFFEGDLGEIFPNLDRKDFHEFDLGLAVGRQPLRFQEGILIDASYDAVGVTRNNLTPSGFSNLRLSGVVGRRDITRGASDWMFALFTASDLRSSSVDVDVAYVYNGGDEADSVARKSVAYAGVGTIQRIHGVNTAFRINGVAPLGDSGVDHGLLTTAEISWTPRRTGDIVYLNGFWALDQFTPIARAVGGPLGFSGILFAGAGLGAYGSALDSSANDVAGGSFGYQKFFSRKRGQVVLELSGRKSTVSEDASSALGARIQHALGLHFLAQVDGYIAAEHAAGGEWDSRGGARIELLTRF